MKKVVRITLGTRGSPLALAQAKIVANLLVKRNRSLDLRIRIKKIETPGDMLQKEEWHDESDNTGKDLFTKSIDNALAKGIIDVAVHSLKDVPVESQSELMEIAAFPKRESPYDVLISKGGNTLSSLKRHARIGTSSVRRAIQVRSFRRDLQVVEIHGNIHTRLKKLETESLDAIILAKAGLNRLGLKNGKVLPIDQMLPAVGQGCLAVVVRKNDLLARSIVSRIDHKDTRAAVTAERSFSRELGGGCNLPIAALGRVSLDTPKQVVLEGLVQRGDVSSDNSSPIARSSISGPVENAELLGRKLSRMMKRFVSS